MQTIADLLSGGETVWGMNILVKVVNIEDVVKNVSNILFKSFVSSTRKTQKTINTYIVSIHLSYYFRYTYSVSII